MNVFGKIEGSVAITRHPKGILRQGELYARGKDVFVRLGAGYVRIVQKFGGEFLTTHPDVKVLEFEGLGVCTSSTGTVTYISQVPLQRAA